ncbi:MAG: EAL domain-containing protein [Oleiphilaceae bacterium]|nr:EAL domain-containing protein [Oleiphilaceae bacterium]
MRLTEFIRSHIEDILLTWEKDARRILPKRDLSREEVLDHVREILLDSVDEIESSGNRQEAAYIIPNHLSDRNTPAYLHGAERLKVGADIVHVSAEFRALRMTVAQLWTSSRKRIMRRDFDDLIRFNNELDKALARSIDRYVHERQQQGRRFEAMLSSLPNPCYILSVDGEFLYANQAMAELCDLSVEDIIGKRLSDMPLPTHYNGKEQLDAVVEHEESREGEVKIETPAGHTRYFEYLYVPVIDENSEVEAVAGITHDITKRKEYESEIWRHANYDVTTQVPNRRLFLDRLSQNAAHSDRTGLPFALLFIDLDRFKEINDKFGHDTGDQVLKCIADRISHCIRQSDTVARIGGDEFTVLLLDTGDPELIHDIATNILVELERPCFVDRTEATVSGSIGVTIYPQDAKNVENLLKNADHAMYVAKKSGRNQICVFTDLMGQSRSERQKLISELRRVNRNKEFRLYFQPIIDLSNGQITKAEALLRWQHPEKGLLLPDTFLPLAEETGLIPAIERWVFEEAASYAEDLGSFSKNPFELSINASPTQLMHNHHTKPWDPHLQTFARCNIRISVELTENIFLHDTEHLFEQFSKLKNAGIRLTLDDFGTGYSSLAYLKRFDISLLKIDQSFVRSDDPGSTNRTIAETIILMAHKLGMKVVAEGVETEAQRDWLKAAGCDYAQGFFFAEALPYEEFSQLLQAGRVFP